MSRLQLAAVVLCLATLPTVLALKKLVVNSTFVPIEEETYDRLGNLNPAGGSETPFGQTTYTVGRVCRAVPQI